MIKPYHAEMRACIRSLLQLKHVAARPVLLCQACQKNFLCTSARGGYYFASSRSLTLKAIGTHGRTCGSKFSFWSTSWLRYPSRHFSVSSTTPHDPNSSESRGSNQKKPSVSSDSKISESQNAEVDAKESSADTSSEKKKNKLLRNEEILKRFSSSVQETEGDTVTPRPRRPNPMDYSYTGNIYILPQRAIMEYLLKASDIEDLPKYTRRSPYADGTQITLYLRSDVEELAVKKWGGFDQLNKEKAKLRRIEHAGKYDMSDWRAVLGETNPTDYINPDDPASHHAGDRPYPDSTPGEPTFWQSGATKVVLSAILVNGANSLFKLIAWLYTGSHSMFSEFIHSCADTMNQVILGIGLYHSFKKPDTDHPYGYRNLRHISSLISGVGIFFFGTGLSFYHSIQGFMHPTELGSLTWCIATLVGSFISEGGTLLIAVNQVRKSCKATNMTFSEYLLRGVDPNVNVVLLEDLAAVVGVGIAGTCITVSHLTGSSAADALGSALIGTLLGCVAAFIVYNNTNQLVGRSIPHEERQDISHLLERDRMIRSLHDIKATQMGGIVRYKAEVDFDGREITRAYLYKQDMDLLLAEAQGLQTVEELENFMLNHGEKVIDMLGEEVDRIEKALKSKHPEIRHVDLEAL